MCETYQDTSSRGLSRREFVAAAAKYGAAAWGAYAVLTTPSWLRGMLGVTHDAYAAESLDKLAQSAPRARYWVATNSPDARCIDCHTSETVERVSEHEHDAVIIKCLLCAQGCMIGAGERGKCHTRMHVNGELRSLVYGRPITIHVDPIEKKPFYHFLPGSAAYSLATSGCALKCQFCQNWQISQILPEDYDSPYTPPEALVSDAAARKAPVIAFTYNEPTVFTEYLTDIARAAKGHDIRSVLVSCGFMNEAPLTEMCEVLDAIKIDLKGFSEDFYRRVCSAELRPVLRSLKQVARSGRHLEIVNLVVPTLNDSDEMLNGLCDWVVGELGPDVPVHFTRFHPDYKLLNLAPTPVSTIERARDMAMSKGMHYAYVGNVPGHAGNNTYCPRCGQIVIGRDGMFVTEMHLKDGGCEFCAEPIPGVWK